MREFGSVLRESGDLGLWAAGCILLPGALLAQSYDPAEGELSEYLADRTVLIRMSCQPEVEAGDEVDIGLIPVEPRVRWGSGVFIRKDGYVATAHHTLGEISRREERAFHGQEYTTACDPAQVKIDFFRTDDLTRAANNGGPTLEEEDSSTRDSRRAVADVLFLKANTRGRDNLPYVCAHQLYQSASEYDDLPISTEQDDLPISTEQIEIQQGGQFTLRSREGMASSDHGDGPASNFLIMSTPAQPGASGAAVVDADGRIVGLVHGYSERVNPAGNDDYLIPYYLFDEVFRDYSVQCAPLPNPTPVPDPTPDPVNLFSATVTARGTSSVSVSDRVRGLGFEGATGPRESTAEIPYGQAVELELQGREDNECQDENGLTQSSASAWGLVTATDEPGASCSRAV